MEEIPYKFLLGCSIAASFVAMVIVNIRVITLFVRIFKKQPCYIYGVCNGVPARKNARSHHVQFMLMQGEARWIDFDKSHWQNFMTHDQHNNFLVDVAFVVNYTKGRKGEDARPEDLVLNYLEHKNLLRHI